MYRKVIEELNKWRIKKDRQPLILTGARQVGKTWILKEFGKEFFDDVLYINFEETRDIDSIFEGNIYPERIIEFLGAYHGKKIEPYKTLIIFDEIQELPIALTSLKYFSENAPEYAICCAGSLLGVFLNDNVSFPVGKVDFLNLNPLDFEEFLIANNEEMLIDFLRKNSKDSIPEIFSNKLNDYLKKYFVIGGMPRAVNAWIETKDLVIVEDIQKGILSSYVGDFSKHVDKSMANKIKYVWDSIPSQFAKENHKFIYGVVNERSQGKRI